MQVLIFPTLDNEPGYIYERSDHSANHEAVIQQIACPMIQSPFTKGTRVLPAVRC